MENERWREIREDKGTRVEQLNAEETIWENVGEDRIGPISLEVFNDSMKGALPDNFNFTKTTKVFDFACGNGRFYKLIENYETEYYGLDISFFYLGKLSKILKKGTLIYSRGMDTFPFPNNYFDLSVACSIFTHLSKTQRRFYLDELTRTLNPKGYLILTFFDFEMGREKFHPLAGAPNVNFVYISGSEIMRAIEGIFDIEKAGILPDAPPSFQTVLTLRKR